MTRETTKRMVAILGVAVFLGGGLVYAVASAPIAGQASAQVTGLDIPDAHHEAESVDEVDILLWGPGVEWSDLPEPPEQAELRVYAESPDGDMEQHGTITCTEGDPTSGQCRWADDDADGASQEQFYIHLLSGSWTNEHFSPDPGEQVSHTIDVGIEADVMWDGGSTSASDTGSTTITIEHPEEAATATEDTTTETEEETTATEEEGTETEEETAETDDTTTVEEDSTETEEQATTDTEDDSTDASASAKIDNAEVHIDGEIYS